MTAAINLPTTQDEIAILRPGQVILPAWGNVRKSPRDPVEFAAFKADVQLRGIIQAITVRPHPTLPDVYELLAGGGRWEAATEFDYPLPALIKHVDDAEGIAIGLKENALRQNMNPVDEANAAKLALTASRGDYKEAALRLNWSESQLKKRLNLTRCSDAVQAAVVGNNETDFKLSLRHADLLAGIREETQDVLLAEIIKTNMSVEELRALLGKAATPLTAANFDTTACNSCEYNTAQQHSLFDEFNASNEAMCRNLTCFKGKHAEHIAQVRAEAESQYGKVILLSEVTQNVMHKLSPESVGSEQYNTHCSFCDHNVSLLDDRLGKDATVINGRCADLACFERCAAQLKLQNSEPETDGSVTTQEGPQTPPAASNSKTPGNPSPATSKAATAAGKGTKQGATAPAAPAALPSRIVEDNKAVLRQAAVAAWGQDQEAATRFQTAVILAALKAVQGGSFAYALPDVLKMDMLAVREEILAGVGNIAGSLNLAGGHLMTDVMIKTMPLVPDAAKFATAAWIPTKERLGLYTKDMLSVIFAESGFQAAYEAKHDEKGYRDLMTMKSGDRIKAVLDFEFDWSGYAPAPLLSAIPQIG